MAKVDVVRQQPDPPPVERVTLTMTPEEAIRVCAILGHAGGKLRNGLTIPHSDGVYFTLCDALEQSGLDTSGLHFD